MNMPRISKEHAAVLRRDVDSYLAARGRTEAAPRPQRSAPPQADAVREEVRAAIAGERVKAALADLRAGEAVSRTIREIVREEVAAANPTPAEKVKRAAQEAHALSADPSERKRLALSALSGIGSGLPPLSLDDLTRETAAAVGCSYAEAAVALTTRDAR